MASKPYRIPKPQPLIARDPGAMRWGSQIHRGELYRIKHPSGDPKRSRVVVVVSRAAHLASRFSTAICAPVYTQRGGLSSEVEVGPAEGLKHASAILCDVLTSFPARPADRVRRHARAGQARRAPRRAADRARCRVSLRPASCLSGQHRILSKLVA